MWIIVLIFVLTTLVYLVKRRYSYWESEGIPHLPPKIPFGNLQEVAQKKKSVGSVLFDIYCNSKERFLGIYLLFRPVLLVRDAELARTMLTTEFSSFHDRGVFLDEGTDIFSLRGQAWRTLRAKLTPSFSSGKLKGMFCTVNDVADKMVEHLNSTLHNTKDEKIEIKDLLTTYAVDIIGSVIFGLEINSFAYPNNEFRMVSKKVFDRHTILEIIRSSASFVAPGISELQVRLGFPDPVIKPLKEIVKTTVKFREQNNISRRDLLQLLIQLRNSGKINEDDKNWNIQTTAEELKSMSLDMIASQAFLFYIAGSETTAASASFTIYELAMNPDLLKRAQTEVDECLKQHNLTPNGKLTYEAVKDMKFLDLCLKETVRLYPGLPFLNRECTRDYQIPDTNYTVKKGTPVIISLLGINRDPQYFPDPMCYDPDRFTEDKMNYNPIAFMPFGEGPRHCIAQRMGMLNAKAAVVKILANFDIETIPHKEVEFAYDPAPALVAKGGLKLHLTKRVF